MLEITQDQRETLRAGNPVRLRAAELDDEEVVVCSATVFDKMESQLRELSDDEKEKEAWVKMSMRNLAQRLQEEDND